MHRSKSPSQSVVFRKYRYNQGAAHYGTHGYRSLDIRASN
jgi:hypothetical protein